MTAEEVKNKDLKQTQIQQPPRDEEMGRISPHPERKRGRRMRSGDQGTESEEEIESEQQDVPQQQKKFRTSPHSGKIDIRI